jgi:asparagine synthase (glutamine-hydrolysing)
MRFIGFLPVRDAQGQAARRTLETCLKRRGLDRVVDAANGLVLLVERGLARVASSDGRILLGDAFDDDGRPARVEDISGLAVEQLVERYWGPFVAIAPCSGPAGAIFGRFHVARDPSGGLDCYLARTGAGLYIASDLALALQAGLPAPQVDWAMLSHDLVHRRARGARTCLVEVEELVPGQAATIGSGKVETRLLWNPWRVVNRSLAGAPFPLAARALRSRIDLCTRVLVDGYDRPAVELSGGLDSSIVTAAADRRDGLSAIHCVSPGPEGDERTYARAVAAAFGLSLEEQTLSVGRFDPARVITSALARPGRPGVLGAAHRIVQAHCRAHRADVVLTGAGGDSVFCSLNTPAPVADRFWACGPGLGFLRSLDDLSHRHNASIWTVAAMTGRSIRRHFNPSRGATTRFLRPEAAPEHQDLHPWLAAAPDRSLLGHSLHIEAIAFILGYMQGQGRMNTIPTLAPLLSRPVLEACLGLPAWRWIEGGRDRAVARAAYRGRLPAHLIDRRSKGGVDHYVVGLFERNRVAVRDLLLDGLLTSIGVLDRPAVEAAFAAPEASRMGDAHRLLDLADAEAWARDWAGVAASTKATADDARP